MKTVQSFIYIKSFFIKQLYLICHVFTMNERSLIKHAAQQGALWPSLVGSLIGWTGFSAFLKSVWMIQQNSQLHQLYKWIFTVSGFALKQGLKGFWV